VPSHSLESICLSLVVQISEQMASSFAKARPGFGSVQLSSLSPCGLGEIVFLLLLDHTVCQFERIPHPGM